MDFSTSGVLVIPLTKLAAQKATKSFETRKVKKYYLALLRGRCEQNFYHVKLPIGLDSRPEVSKIKVATSDSEYCQKPRSAETKINVLSRGIFQGKDTSNTKLTFYFQSQCCLETYHS